MAQNTGTGFAYASTTGPWTSAATIPQRPVLPQHRVWRSDARAGCVFIRMATLPSIITSGDACAKLMSRHMNAAVVAASPPKARNEYATMPATPAEMMYGDSR